MPSVDKVEAISLSTYNFVAASVSTNGSPTLCICKLLQFILDVGNITSKLLIPIFGVLLYTIL